MARKSREEAIETREKILESALETMSGKTFSQVSMNEIAERVGFSKGAVYWHFKNRNDLLVKLLENMTARLEEELECNGREWNTLDDIRHFFRNRLEKAFLSERFQRMHRLMVRRFEWPPEVQEKVRVLLLEKIDRERGMLEKCLVGLQREGKIRNDVSPRELSAVLSVVFHGLFLAHLSEMCPDNFAVHVDFIIDALVGKINPVQ